MRHHMLADAVAIIGTMDLVFGSVFSIFSAPSEQRSNNYIQRSRSIGEASSPAVLSNLMPLRVFAIDHSWKMHLSRQNLRYVSA